MYKKFLFTLFVIIELICVPVSKISNTSFKVLDVIQVISKTVKKNHVNMQQESKQTMQTTEQSSWATIVESCTEVESATETEPVTMHATIAPSQTSSTTQVQSTTQTVSTTQAPSTEPPTPPTCESTSESFPDSTLNRVEGLNSHQQELLTISIMNNVNLIRKQNNVGLLTLDTPLISIAAIRANEVSVLWSHTRPDGSRGVDMIPKDKWRGENLCKITISGFDGGDEQILKLSQRIVDNWIASSEHYKNLLMVEYTKAGTYTYVVKKENGALMFYTAIMLSN